MERYDHAAARHYAAFRPPLHERILERLIAKEERFAAGLDLGCGTGRSAVALARHCSRVTGLDASAAMLAAAQADPRVEYVLGGVDWLGQASSRFAVLTFAGSLVYLKGTRLRAALPGVCAPGAAVLVYDFEILLDDVLAVVGVPGPPGSPTYDHGLNLADWTEYRPVCGGRERWPVEADAAQLSHLLLSDSRRHDVLARRFETEDPFLPLAALLGDCRAGMAVTAEVHFARYEAPGAGRV